jgi:hypothetical protein
MSYGTSTAIKLPLAPQQGHPPLCPLPNLDIISVKTVQLKSFPPKSFSTHYPWREILTLALLTTRAPSKTQMPSDHHY